jgi:glycosyltransferase involved in cell wall biosynthesis
MNPESPWLTVVTVVKDDPIGLEVSIASLRSQSVRDIEYLVIDSSVDSEEVKRVLALSGSPHARLEWTEPQGIYSAMNRGLEGATGEYIYFLNAGDSFYSDEVLEELHSLIKSSSPQWIVGLVEIQKLNGNSVISAEWDYAAEKRALFARGRFPPHQGTVVRTTTLRSVGGFDEKYRIAADYAAALALSEVSDPLMSPRIIAKFVEGGVSTSHWRESFREFHRARREIFTPVGFTAIVEIFHYWTHFGKVFLARSLKR